ncbi:SDR family oxidoreductase, partial [Acinetobacter baumannii]
NVAFCARDAGRLDAVAAELSAQYGAAVHAAPCDVLDEAAVRAFIAGTCDRFGGLDILVNNAALMVEITDKPLIQTDRARFDKGLAVNVWGALN